MANHWARGTALVHAEAEATAAARNILITATILILIAGFVKKSIAVCKADIDKGRWCSGRSTSGWDRAVLQGQERRAFYGKGGEEGEGQRRYTQARSENKITVDSLGREKGNTMNCISIEIIARKIRTKFHTHVGGRVGPGVGAGVGATTGAEVGGTGISQSLQMPFQYLQK